MDFMTIAAIIGGLVLLVIGGEFLVRGAVDLATRLGVSPLLIGLTLVGFGTSTPELVTSIQAAIVGAPGIAIGNIVGSNLANILLILGLSALVYPIIVDSRALWRDALLVAILAIVCLPVAWWVGLDRYVGVIALMILVAYLVYAWRQESATTADHTAAFERGEALAGFNPGLVTKKRSGNGRAIAMSTATALGGIVLVILGGRFLVDGSISLARALDIDEAVIGLTIVAVGTSMPELVTSAVAAFRRQADVAFGNVLGSNIYNTLFIGGVTGIVAPTEIPARIAAVDIPVMVGVSLLLFLFAWTGLRIGRREGGVLLAGYVIYLWMLWPS